MKLAKIINILNKKAKFEYAFLEEYTAGGGRNSREIYRRNVGP
jgi:tmRNA-binding protein